MFFFGLAVMLGLIIDFLVRLGSGFLVLIHC